MKHETKRYSDYLVDRVHDYILSCGGIISGKGLAKAVHISENYAQSCTREAIKRYSDIESIPGLGYRKKGIDYSYSITANLYSAEANDYICHWDGPTFKRMSSLNKAKECWNGWWPPEVDAKMKRDKGAHGIWSNRPIYEGQYIHRKSGNRKNIIFSVSM